MRYSGFVHEVRGIYDVRCETVCTAKKVSARGVRASEVKAKVEVVGADTRESGG